MVNVKTPNKKRKSVANTESGGSPKVAKLDTPLKTPGKGKGNATPGKPNKTPKQQNNPKTPKQTPQNQGQISGKKNKRNVGASESENENSSPKKLKVFGGTSQLQGQKKGGKPKGEKKEGKKFKKGQFFGLKEKVKSGDKLALQEIEAKIKSFEQRKDLTKTAKRKLKLLLRLKRAITGEKAVTEVKTKTTGEAASKKQKKGKNENAQKKTEKQKVLKTTEDEDDLDESDYDVESEIKPTTLAKTESDEEDSDAGEEEEDSNEEEEEEGSDDEEGEEDESGDEEEASSGDDEEVPALVQIGKKSNPPGSRAPDLQELKENKIIDSKKTRYIVFVGNLPYDAAKQEISEHFSKAGQVRHIRIPNDKKTDKPRGFAYVEFNDEISYQKALSMHHTFIKGRRINCLYTQGGKKKGAERKNEVKVKNLKLQAMRKQGQLAGSVKENQKRSARRGKKNAVNGS